MAGHVTDPDDARDRIADAPNVKAADPHRFISELAGLFSASTRSSLAVVISGSALLLLASKHGDHRQLPRLPRVDGGTGFMPSALSRRNTFFGTPQIAIMVATGRPDPGDPDQRRRDAVPGRACTPFGFAGCVPPELGRPRRWLRGARQAARSHVSGSGSSRTLLVARRVGG